MSASRADRNGGRVGDLTRPQWVAISTAGRGDAVRVVFGACPPIAPTETRTDHGPETSPGPPGDHIPAPSIRRGRQLGASSRAQVVARRTTSSFGNPPFQVLMTSPFAETNTPAGWAVMPKYFHVSNDSSHSREKVMLWRAWNFFASSNPSWVPRPMTVS